MSNIPGGMHREELWNALVETAHALLMYKSHKRYLEETLLKQRPDISAKELAVRLAIPIGEALVLLSETRGEMGKPKHGSEVAAKSDGRSLLDYTQ